MSGKAQYKRILLKISGQAMSDRGGIDPAAVAAVIGEIRPVIELGVQVALVVGGGNFLRGRDLADNPAIHRVTADYMGMLGTVINALALRDSMEAEGLQARVLSAIPMPQLGGTYSVRRAVDHLLSGRVVILAAGTGSPYFTTDMCAALRANEIDAEVLLKATKVDGVFDSDPVRNPQANKYERLSYQKVLADRLGVMDLTAISMCMETSLPIVVFQLAKAGNLLRAVMGEHVGTTVSDQP